MDSWYYKFYLWLIDFFKLFGDVYSYSDDKTWYYGHQSFLAVFLPAIVMIYSVILIITTIIDYRSKISAKHNFSNVKYITRFKIHLMNFTASLLINFATMIIFFFIVFLFNYVGVNVLMFFALIVGQLILRYNDNLDNESVFNIVPSISRYTNDILWYYRKLGEYKLNYEKVKNTEIWK